MVVHRCVPFAFVRAGLTSENAGMQLRMDDFVRRFRLSCDQPRGELADFGTIQIGANATPEMRHVVFRQARIRTCRANLRTHRQRRQSFGVIFDVLQIGVRMRPQHRIDHFHGLNGFVAEPFRDAAS